MADGVGRGTLAGLVYGIERYQFVYLMMAKAHD